MLTSIPAWPISIETALTQWVITAMTSPSWVHDPLSPQSASEIGDASCSGIGRLGSDGVGISATGTS